MSDTLRAELALDALEMAVWSRGDRMDGQIVHHSDRGVQYTAIRYTERLGEIGAVRSVGRKGDRKRQPSRSTAFTRKSSSRGKGRGAGPMTSCSRPGMGDWYNTERLHSACKYIPPKEYEENYYAQQERMVS